MRNNTSVMCSNPILDTFRACGNIDNFLEDFKSRWPITAAALTLGLFRLVAFGFWCKFKGQWRWKLQVWRRSTLIHWEFSFSPLVSGIVAIRVWPSRPVQGPNKVVFGPPNWCIVLLLFVFSRVSPHGSACKFNNNSFTHIFNLARDTISDWSSVPWLVAAWSAI